MTHLRHWLLFALLLLSVTLASFSLSQSWMSRAEMEEAVLKSQQIQNENLDLLRANSELLKQISRQLKAQLP